MVHFVKNRAVLALADARVRHAAGEEEGDRSWSNSACNRCSEETGEPKVAYYIRIDRSSQLDVTLRPWWETVGGACFSS